MFDYYLGWLSNGGTPANHFNFLDGSTVRVRARVGDGDRARRRRAGGPRGARRRAPQVILGGHSLGASLTVAYASLGLQRPARLQGRRRARADRRRPARQLPDAYRPRPGEGSSREARRPSASPFSDLLGLGFPEAAGLFADVGGIYARLAPTASAATLQSYPAAAGRLQPPCPGHQPGAVRLRVRPRHLPGVARAPARERRRAWPSSGDPRDWVDGGVTPIANLAEDLRPAAERRGRVVLPRPAADRHERRRGAEAERRRQVPGPAASTGRGRWTSRSTRSRPTSRTAASCAERAGSSGRRETTTAESTLVNADPQMSHLDPLTAASGKNTFLKTVVPFLKSTFR